MDLNEYQEKAITTAVFPKDKALPYLALGLSGEAAEVANKSRRSSEETMTMTQQQPKRRSTLLPWNLVMFCGILLSWQVSWILGLTLSLLAMWINWQLVH